MLDFLNGKMQEPTLYGWFHLLCWGIVIAASVVVIVFRKKIYLNAEDNKLFDAKKQLICYYNDLGKYHLIIFAVCAFLTTIGSLIKALSFIGIVGFLCMPMAGILGTNHILGGFVGLISHLILLPLIVLGTKYVHFKFNCNVKKWIRKCSGFDKEKGGIVWRNTF